jgi:hypothetical protein
MRVSVRMTLVALSAACLAIPLGGLPASPALAQAKQAAPADAPELNQIVLTDKQIQDVLASAKDIAAIIDKLPNDSPPDAKSMAQLEAAVRKDGFSSYDDYSNVVDNISLVMSGIDPDSKKYVGSEALIRSQIAQVQADKTMKAEDKKEALESLAMAQKAKVPEVKNKGNIDLVLKYYDQIAAALGDDPT